MSPRNVGLSTRRLLAAICVTFGSGASSRVDAAPVDLSIELGSKRWRLTPTLLASGVSSIGRDGASATLSQAELGLSVGSDTLSVEGVLAISEESASLAVLLAQVTVLGDAGLLGKSDHQLELGAGRMDLPVGLDPDRYSDADRPMISQPLVLMGTHAGWNDFGGRLGWGYDDLQVQLFGARGFDPDASGPAVGARVVYGIGEHLHLGASGVALLDDGLAMRGGLAELDARLAWGEFTLEVEGLLQTTTDAPRRMGAYVMAHQVIDIFEAAARAELFWDGLVLEPRLSACVGVQLWSEALRMRAEYGVGLSGGEDHVTVQFVASL